MKRDCLIAAIALVTSVLAASPAHAQNPDLSAPYVLQNPPSEFVWGCFAPCECPVMSQTPIEGSFVLSRAGIEPPFTVYHVLDVHWHTTTGTVPVVITGSGTYRIGGDPQAQEQLTLDLSFDGLHAQHFDSGLQPAKGTFPVIDMRVSLHGEFCHDSVVAIRAGVSSSGTGGGELKPPSLTAAPNPFSGSTEIGFTLPRAGRVEVAVFDIAGRRLRSLAEGWYVSGAYIRSWDGRLDNGDVAEPGLYVVRLDTPSGRTARTVAKLK